MRAILLVFVMILVLAPAVLLAEDRHVAVIIDTSGSMINSDPPRYTVQLTQIISDLLDTTDHLTVIRLPLGSEDTCREGVTPGLALSLDDRARFKTALDRMIEYDGGNTFAAPVRTAIHALSRASDKPRLLLMIADSGGLGNCAGGLTRELVALRNSGTTIAAINIGSTTGAFEGNPAFDFTLAALNAERLVEAVARFYQRFLGAKKVQTGRVYDTIEVEITPFVQEVFLVVAADGPVPRVESSAGNPQATAIDPNHRGGGQTRGLDGRIRGYRIVRLERPEAGSWRFRVPNLRDRAGWMLLQDSAVGLRMISSPDMVLGQSTPVELELVDRGTGRRITDPDKIPGLTVKATVNGRTTEFSDDGRNGDREAGDGVFTALVRPDTPGLQRFEAYLQGELLDRRIPFEVQVVEVSWELQITTPPRAMVGSSVNLGVRARASGPARMSATSIERVRVLADEREIAILRDDGIGSDEHARDGYYGGTWTPEGIGTFSLRYFPEGGLGAQPLSAPLEVVGSLKFGPPQPIHLGRVEHDSQVKGVLDLSGIESQGNFRLKVSSDYALGRTALEIATEDGWEVLDSDPVVLELLHQGSHTWPLRLRTGRCPEGCLPGETFAIRVEGSEPNGRLLTMMVPLTVEVVEQPWLACWWPVIAIVLSVAALGLIVYGFWSPSRFPSRLGVILSQEADLNEGFFHPIRAQKGTGSGFYRDACVYVCHDYRLSGKTRNAIARLRAHRSQVRIEPEGGVGLLRLTPEENWEPLPTEETTARFGIVYRDEGGNLFFELSNG